ncbi:MAG: hypothetical protein ACI9CA_000325 [Natronomonas sp.]|jgi:hypothetical protein
MSDDEDFEFRVESRLTSHGVYVDEVADTPEGYEVAYESVSADSEGVVPHREVGRVINVFRDLHDEDWAGADIDAVVTDLEGEERGRWHVEAAWLDRLHNGDLTEVAFSEKVVETIELAE